MKKYDIYVNVNFHDDDEDNITRTIEIKMDKGGGWSPKVQSGGTWLLDTLR